MLVAPRPGSDSFPSSVKSVSVKPRLAGRQPSSARGAPGEDVARSRPGRASVDPLRSGPEQCRRLRMTILAVQPCPAAEEADVAPLAAVVGADLRVPLVRGGSARYVNLDYAASAPALRAVADRVAELLPLYSSVHRGAGYASTVCTSAYEGARAEIAGFVGARDDDVVVFTRNTTDALNLLAAAVPEDGLGGALGLGGVVHLDIEHHANLLPWQ